MSQLIYFAERFTSQMTSSGLVLPDDTEEDEENGYGDYYGDYVYVTKTDSGDSLDYYPSYTDTDYGTFNSADDNFDKYESNDYNEKTEENYVRFEESSGTATDAPRFTAETDDYTDLYRYDYDSLGGQSIAIRLNGNGYYDYNRNGDVENEMVGDDYNEEYDDYSTQENTSFEFSSDSEVNSSEFEENLKEESDKSISRIWRFVPTVEYTTSATITSTVQEPTEPPTELPPEDTTRHARKRPTFGGPYRRFEITTSAPVETTRHYMEAPTTPTPVFREKYPEIEDEDEEIVEEKSSIEDEELYTEPTESLDMLEKRPSFDKVEEKTDDSSEEEQSKEEYKRRNETTSELPDIIWNPVKETERQEHEVKTHEKPMKIPEIILISSSSDKTNGSSSDDESPLSLGGNEITFQIFKNDHNNDFNIDRNSDHNTEDGRKSDELWHLKEEIIIENDDTKTPKENVELEGKQGNIY